MELKHVLEQSGNLNYGIIGNCKSSALIYEDSSIDWCCLPQFDSPSVFGKILDKDIPTQKRVGIESESALNFCVLLI